MDKVIAEAGWFFIIMMIIAFGYTYLSITANAIKDALTYRINKNRQELKKNLFVLAAMLAIMLPFILTLRQIIDIRLLNYLIVYVLGPVGTILAVPVAIKNHMDFMVEILLSNTTRHPNTTRDPSEISLPSGFLKVDSNGMFVDECDDSYDQLYMRYYR